MATVDGRRLEALVRAFDRALSALERDAIVRLDGALRYAAANLERELRRLYVASVSDLAANPNRLLREARARMLLEQVRAGLDLTSGAQANSVFNALIGDSFDLGARNALDMLSAYQSGLVSLSSNARLVVAARATQASLRLAHHGSELALKVEELVIDGIVRGRGWGRTAAELRRETGLTRWKAEQLVRTESVSASAASRTDTFRSNGVEAEQVLCTMDDRLCAWCASRAGRAYKLGEIELPFHPNCRCTTIPYRPEWRELGLTDDDWMTEHRRASLARADGPPKTGPTPWERQRGLTKAPEPIWSP